MNTERSLSLLLVDDEALARGLLREYLAGREDFRIVGECANGLEAVEAIGRETPDLVLLDVQMPGLTGIEVLEATGRRGGVIFTTAYDEYALKAFDFQAIDYLLKPFTRERFFAALERARASLGAPSAALSQLVAADTARAERLLVPMRGRMEVVKVDEIDYVEAEDDYINIHAGGRTLMKTQSLSELAAELDSARFARIHRSYLLNLARLTSLERPSKDSVLACLADGTRLPVSRKGVERLRELLPDL
jgi:two-component system LytT family response regulator